MKKIAVLLISALLSTSVFAAKINQIVFFGDSLSDNGNLHNLFKIIPKSPPYFEGRFSNGPTWAEHVANHYAAQGVTSLNYAYGGATLMVHDRALDNFLSPTTVTTEIYSYLLQSVFDDKSKVLYAIWAGSNDYLYDKNPDTQALSNQLVGHTLVDIETLITQGATHFLILNLPDLARTPHVKSAQLTDRMHTLSQLHNAKLSVTLAQLKLMHPNITITYINIYDLFNDILDHLDKYNQQYGLNIHNTAESCWSNGTAVHNTADLNRELQNAFGIDPSIDLTEVSEYILSTPELTEAYALGKSYDQGLKACANPEEHFFWDEMHPSADVHRVLGQSIIATLDKEGLF